MPAKSPHCNVLIHFLSMDMLSSVFPFKTVKALRVKLLQKPAVIPACHNPWSRSAKSEDFYF